MRRHYIETIEWHDSIYYGIYTVSQKRSHLYTLCNFVKSSPIFTIFALLESVWNLLQKPIQQYPYHLRHVATLHREIKNSKSCTRCWIPCWSLTNTAVTSAVTNLRCHKLLAKVITKNSNMHNFIRNQYGEKLAILNTENIKICASITKLKAVSYTHLTLPTNREV